jgi:hypothetical protein
MHQRADGAESYPELAEKYGMSHQGVKEFASRHKPEIVQIREQGAEELPWMWGANRQKKLGELEANTKR